MEEICGHCQKSNKQTAIISPFNGDRMDCLAGRTEEARLSVHKNKVKSYIDRLYTSCQKLNELVLDIHPVLLHYL